MPKAIAPNYHLSNTIQRPIDYGNNDTVATMKPEGLAYLLLWPELAVSTYGTISCDHCLSGVEIPVLIIAKGEHR